MTRVELVDRMRESGVLWRGYRDGARGLVPLAVPGALVNAPLAGLALVLLIGWAGPSAAVVNGRLDLIGVSGGELLTWTAGPAVAAVLAQAVVFPATVVLAAGRLAGRRVPPGTALRMAIRRFPAMLVLVVVAVAGYAAVAAAGFGVLAVTGREWPSGFGAPEVTGREWPVTAVMVVLGLAATPALLAVPSVMLHGCSALGGIGRAYRLIRYRGLPAACTLALGVVVVPVVVVRAVAGWVELLPGPLGTAGWAAAGTVTALAVTPFQAAVVARQFLHGMAWRTEVRDEDLEHGVPAGSAERVRAAVLWPVVLAPGLLFSGIVLVNPFGWTEVAETVVSGGDDGTTVTAGGSGRRTEVVSGDEAAAPMRLGSLRPWDLRSAHLGRNGELAVAVDGLHAPAGVLTCADFTCERMSVAGADTARISAMEMEIGAVATRLPDGRLALATWSGRRLRLWFCAADRCDRAPGETVLAEARDPSYPPGVALAARRDGGLVVAVAERELTRDGTERTRDSGTASAGVDDLVSFIFCADAACSRPERRRPVRLDEVDYLSTMPLLTLALGPGDRPLAARLDLTTGRIQVISCADATCRESRVTTPVAAYAARNDVGLRRQAGLALAVRADGRPVIAYRDVRDRAAKLLDCRTPDCARADVITLDAGGPDLGTPALVLDRTGRVLVAFHNGEGTRVMLAVCAGGRCTSTPVARIRGGADESLAMTLDGGGRPVIVWLDWPTGPEINWELAVVTPLNLTR